MNISEEKIRYVLQFLFDRDENASEAAENVDKIIENAQSDRQASIIFDCLRIT